ncbi:MAG: NYN domain-containing protein [Planctomycetes bacterium]|nr:NYN domain-containing protein [Planctomycetota bacterium]
MNRVTVFIDGFNLYHSLNARPFFYKYKWLNLAKLAACFINPKNTEIIEIYYFTAYSTWNKDKLNRHQTYVKALQFVNVKPILGVFRYIDLTCPVCHKSYNTFREKRTDVNIAINLFQTAIDDTWDTALIISGDSDLIPAIASIKKKFPAKRIGVVIPIGRRAEELKQVADFHMKIKTKHLATCQFDDVIKVDNSLTLNRPSSWK